MIAGAAYVVFGRESGFPAVVDLENLDGANGFAVLGTAGSLGRAVSSAGDMNGDGFDDVLLGAWFAGDIQQGESYVVFGQPEGFPASIRVADLDGTNGFAVIGIDFRDRSGRTVSNAGDINADGYDDIIISALYADPGGECYVIFGIESGFPAVIDAASLDGVVGFTLLGIGGSFGRGVSGAGDVNGDGFDDILVGAPYAGDGGEVYLIYGRSGTYPASLSMADLDDSKGFVLAGAMPSDAWAGRSARITGDVNGDGFDDIIVGAHYADHSGGSDQGKAYVVFGGNSTGGVETQVGGDGADTLTANQGAAVDILIGGRGDDTLVSNGGDDVLRGGEGDDIHAIPDADFSGSRRLQGGNGTDMLRLMGSGIALDLTQIADNRITDIERIDIRGSGSNSLTLDFLEVLNLSTHSNTLVVRGDADDVVHIGSGWARQANDIEFGQSFEVFAKGAAVLKVEAAAAVTQGVTDIVGRDTGTGTVLVGVSDGSQFHNQVAGVIPPGVDWDELVTGDFNGDGLLDLAGRSPSDGWWRVLPATNDGFATPQLWGAWSTNVAFDTILVGDYDGDGRDDVAGWAETGTWVVGLSNGLRFTTSAFSDWSTTAGFDHIQVGDFNGDGLSDIAGVSKGGRWVVGLSDGSRFASSSFAIWSTTAGFHDIQVGDFNGDGLSDIAGVSRGGRWVVGLSDGSRFALSSFAIWSTADTFDHVRVGDFNGDGKSDIAALSAGGRWVVGLSDGVRFALSSFASWPPGARFDEIRVGDFNGDGYSDIARLSANGTWVVGVSDGTKFASSVFTRWSRMVTWDNIAAGNFA